MNVLDENLKSLVFEPLITAIQAASLLQIHPNTLLMWARHGKVPSIRLGRRVAFRASQLNRWLKEQYNDFAVRVASTDPQEAA